MKWPKANNLFQQLFLFFLIAILIPLFITSLIIYNRSANSIQNQIGEYLEKNVLVTNVQVERFLKEYEKITFPLVTDRHVKDFIELGPGEELQRYQLYNEIKGNMNRIKEQSSAIDLIYIITDEQRSVVSDTHYYGPLDPFPAENVYDELYDVAPNTGKVAYKLRQTIDGRIVITFTRKIRGVDFKPGGILGVDLSLSSIGEFWSVANIGEGSELMIIDDQGTIIYHPQSELFGSNVGNEILTEINKRDSGSFLSTWDDIRNFYYYHTSDLTNWTTVTSIPEKELFKPISGIRLTAFISGGLSLLVASALAFYFTRNIVKPIRLLQRHLRNMEKGIWSKVPEFAGPSEIVSLVRSYNRMIDELTNLIDRVYTAELHHQKVQLKVQEREIEMQKNELQALQSQINPHFLYNTLETMNAYGLIQGSDEISEMVESLAYMFRYSVKNLEVVKLVDELDHIRSYLIIQEHRTRKNFDLEVRIPSELLLCDTVKLSLQPLVENAIEHGMLKRKKHGKIIIDAEEKNDLLYISVEDNGDGISTSRVKEINKFLKITDQEQEISGAAGIGLKNIHRRIQLLFGDKYGLYIESELNKGTKITMTVPATK